MKISRVAIGFLAVFCSVIPTETHAEIVPAEDGAFHVRAGGNIQDALDAAAAADARHKHVKVHAGTYRPATHKQAFLHFNRRHDGITLEAVGEPVTLFEGVRTRPSQYAVSESGSFAWVPGNVETEAGEPARPQINIVLNWFEELTERVPVP